jgi:excisionase family DNA binding protein
MKPLLKSKEQMQLPFPSSQNISVRRAAKMISCHFNTVYRLIDRGDLYGYQLTPGGWWKISYDSVVQYLHELRKRYPLGGQFGTGDSADMFIENSSNTPDKHRASP